METLIMKGSYNKTGVIDYVIQSVVIILLLLEFSIISCLGPRSIHMTDSWSFVILLHICAIEDGRGDDVISYKYDAILTSLTCHMTQMKFEDVYWCI